MSARILIVDDDPGLRRLLAMQLKLEGYQVTEADSGEKALALFPTIEPRLVITDMKMGGMDGIAVFESIRKSHPSLPVIILTAHGTIPDAVAATRQGVFGYLTKPFERETLLKEVTRALDHWIEPASGSILTASPVMRALLEDAALVAQGDASILITGETGTGKEMLARTIHETSVRRGRAFVAINCAAIPEALLESELFGHVKGAFSGATRDYPGLFKSAEGGSLFLDEIGDLPIALQAKLLRVLQDHEVRPVGSTHSVRVNVRILSATHRDLEQEIAAGRFREDLYYRLNVVTLALPPLSARREDIPLLAKHFLTELASRYGKNITGFAPEALTRLVAASWPGNVRQLLNVVEKTVALATTPLIPAALLERAMARQSEDLASLDEAKQAFERDYLVRLLKLTSGNVAQAAKLARRNRSEFYSLLHRHHLEPSLFKSNS